MIFMADKSRYLVHEGADIIEAEGQTSLCRRATDWQGELVTAEIQMMQDLFSGHLCQCRDALNLEGKEENGGEKTRI